MNQLFQKILRTKEKAHKASLKIRISGLGSAEDRIDLV
jgi:hypothetical protein